MIIFTITSAELAPPFGMMQSSAYQIPPPRHLYSGGQGGPTFIPTNFYSSWQGIAQHGFIHFCLLFVR